MQVSVHLPGEAGQNAAVVRWLKNPGQPVMQGDLLAQVLIAGQPAGVLSPGTGILSEIYARPGQGLVTPAAVAAIQLRQHGPATELIPWSTMRHNMASHLVVSTHSSVHVTTHLEADMTWLKALRQQQGAAFHRQYGIPLGFAPFFVRAAAQVLPHHPLLNAQVTPQGMVHQREYHVGFVVAVPGGTRIPKIMHANRKSLAQIALEMHALAARARAGQLYPTEERGGTFTVSSTGAEGGLLSTPVIPYPNVAMLGYDAITDRPAAVNGRVEVRPMIYMNLSFDHRLVDGRDAARFLRDVRKMLEEPVM